MISVRVDLGRAVVWLTSAKRPPTPPNLNHPLGFLANDNLHQFEFCSAQGRSLSRQRGLCLGALSGASRRLSRGPSLGDSTSAGAENSQVTISDCKQELVERLVHPDFAVPCCWVEGGENVYHS
jgi:hypothetical protein